jgi:hypothetical protein
VSTPEQPSARAYLRLVLLGAAIGIPAALVAALFLAAATGYLVFVGFGHWGGLHRAGSSS